MRQESATIVAGVARIEAVALSEKLLAHPDQHRGIAFERDLHLFAAETAVASHVPALHRRREVRIVLDSRLNGVG